MHTLTSAEDASLETDKSDWLSPVLCAGLICGVLDIAAAFIHAGVQGVNPLRLLKGIASALLGAGAAGGGWAVAALGLGMHFVVALTAAAVFGLGSRRFSWLTRQAVWSGLVYGAVVYLVMNLVVLPLAAEFRSLYLPATKPFVPRLGWVQLGIHLGCVGLPIALTWRWFSRRAAGRETAAR